MGVPSSVSETPHARAQHSKRHMEVDYDESRMKRSRIEGSCCMPFGQSKASLSAYHARVHQGALNTMSSFHHTNVANQNHSIQAEEISLISESRKTPAILMKDSRFWCGFDLLKKNTSNNAKVITETMKCHPMAALLQLEGMRSLRRMVKSNGGDFGFLIELGAGTIIIDALYNHKESMQIQIIGLDLVRILVILSSDFKRRVGGCPKTIHAIINALARLSSNRHVQQICLSLVSWLVELKEARRIIIEECGVSLILSSMIRFAFDPLVQCNGAAALCWLIHAEGQDATGGILSHSEGTTLLLQILSCYVDNASVYGNFMCILSGILQVATPAGHAETEEYLRLAVLGIRKHKASTKVQRNCLTLIRILLLNHPARHEALIESRCIDDILGTMKIYASDCSIQTESCRVLAHLCDTEKGRSTLLASGCIEAVLNSQMRHSTNSRMQHAAISFHACLLQNEVDEERLAAFGGGTQVISAMFLGVEESQSIQ